MYEKARQCVRAIIPADAWHGISRTDRRLEEEAHLADSADGVNTPTYRRHRSTRRMFGEPLSSDTPVRGKLHDVGVSELTGSGISGFVAGNDFKSTFHYG
jgi:hypothetical protein